jgi:hypothetical protein
MPIESPAVLSPHEARAAAMYMSGKEQPVTYMQEGQKDVSEEVLAAVAEPGVDIANEPEQVTFMPVPTELARQYKSGEISEQQAASAYQNLVNSDQEVQIIDRDQAAAAAEQQFGQLEKNTELPQRADLFDARRPIDQGYKPVTAI